jgi:5'-3' exonuclease
MEQRYIKVALIDFDPIFFIIGHTHRDTDPNDVMDKLAVKKAVDSMLDMIMTMTGSTDYVIALSDDKENWRKIVYRYAPYKGGRGEKPEFIAKWKPVIVEYLIENYQIHLEGRMEADDIVATAADRLRLSGHDYVVCSPDKDLLQIPGKHWNYVKAADALTVEITKEQAHYNLWLQVLTGDGTDNVAGVPGMGPVKGAKILKEVDPIEYLTTVKGEYRKYYGDYYGPIIFDETYMVIRLERNCPGFIVPKLYIPTHERVGTEF